jgi:hypothetical protein
MAIRLASLLPRFLGVVAIWVLATATLTFAAENRLDAGTTARPLPSVPQPTVVVPDVRGQTFVFAKGILQDGGFAWRVTGPVHGYSTNVVRSQTPAPGTRLRDTGAPTIVVRLARGRYAQTGTPDDVSPYEGTSALPAVAPNRPKPAKARPLARPKKLVKKAVVKPKLRPVRRHKTVPHRVKRTAPPRRRRPAFVVPGARKEPQNEISLPERARRLDAWLTPQRGLTNANVEYWLYQHAWIVTGAKFGWWHGAQALQILIRVDERVQRQWGIGGRSLAVAREALTTVAARSR